MRLLLLVTALLSSTAGCVGRDGDGGRGRWMFGPFARPPEPTRSLTYTRVAPAELEITEDHHGGTVHYRVRPPVVPGGVDLRLVELRFRDPLDGARVDARGAGARQTLTLLHGRRIGGDRLTIPVGALPLESIDVVVHHHLRPTPLVEQVTLGWEKQS